MSPKGRPSNRHVELIDALCQKHGASRRGFRKAFAEARANAATPPDPPESLYRMTREYLNAIRIFPDAYRFSMREGDMGMMVAVDLWEVTVTSRLTPERLYNYTDLYMWCYDAGVLFGLWEVDHHGNETLIMGDDMEEHWTAQIMRYDLP